MIEPPALLAARRHLSQAESAFQSEGGLMHLEEGLALLEEVIAAADPQYRDLARNIASAYALKICRSIEQRLAEDRAVPEPELEHLFSVMLAFDHGELELPAQARSIKIELAQRLIDRYYEGHAPEHKSAALRQLARIIDGERAPARRAKQP